jgi:3-dehydroquinate synthase
MSDYFEVASSTGAYGVRIGRGLLQERLCHTDQQILLCDDFFAPAIEAQGLKLISINATESSKSLDQMEPIIAKFRSMGATRTTRVLALGGGVIQDIATFVASLYMRGLKWDYLPTTLLGMVDSCIGGKSSINVGPYKNLIGNFYPPANIYIDQQFINTLNTEQRAAGLVEAVKICFAHTGEAFDGYIAIHPLTDSSPDIFLQVIRLALATKRWFIEIDEHDQKERLLLNYGHTFGHAIEGACNFAIPHGIAVGMGMLAAIEFARLNRHFAKEPARVTQLAAYVRSLLATVTPLAAWTREIAVDELIDRFGADKKHTDTHYCVILPDGSGHLKRLMLEKTEANRKLIDLAFRKVGLGDAA